MLGISLGEREGKILILGTVEFIKLGSKECITVGSALGIVLGETEGK